MPTIEKARARKVEANGSGVRFLAPRPRVPKLGRLMTSEEFLEWIPEKAHADLIAGQIHVHSPVNVRHANLVNFLDHLLHAYLEAADIAGALHRESVAVRLSARETFMPDIGFFNPHQVARFATAHIPVAPLFCVEVLSQSSAKRDLGPKFAAYEAHGVQEYWVVDSVALAHRFFRRSGELFEEFAQGEDRVHSVAIPGFWVRRAWLDPEATPKVATCLREILKARRRRA
jgi:Uma2 family endonuclease